MRRMHAAAPRGIQRNGDPMRLVLIILLILLLLGALPLWPHSRSWGYFPSGGLGLLLLILIIVVLVRG